MKTKVNGNTLQIYYVNEKYQGYRVRINYGFENIKSTFSIDIATGDAITPAPNILTYDSIITGKSIKVDCQH